MEKIVEAASRRSLPIFTFCEELLLSSEIKLSHKQREGLRDYISIIHSLRNKRPHLSLHELISEAISASRYLSYLQEDQETFQDRKENVDELIGKAAEWQEETPEPSLSKFLEELSLRTHTENQEQIPTIKMMTIHNSKGLEFNLVFLVGLEEDLFPHINSKDKEESLEEERRLCYVGMTRANASLSLLGYVSLYVGCAADNAPFPFFKRTPRPILGKFIFSHSSYNWKRNPLSLLRDFHPGIKSCIKNLEGERIKEPTRALSALPTRFISPMRERTGPCRKICETPALSAVSWILIPTFHFQSIV